MSPMTVPSHWPQPTIEDKSQAETIAEIYVTRADLVMWIAAICAQRREEGRDALAAEVRKFYRADGSFEEMEPEQVVQRRIACAVELESLRAENARLRGELDEWHTVYGAGKQNEYGERAMREALGDVLEMTHKLRERLSDEAFYAVRPMLEAIRNRIRRTLDPKSDAALAAPREGETK